MPSPPNYKVPYVVSRYLGHTIYLDEIGDLSDKELALLETEVFALREDCSRSLERADLTSSGAVAKLLRTSSTFLYAIEQEQTRRQRKLSILDLLEQLNAVTKERDALKNLLSTRTVS